MKKYLIILTLLLIAFQQLNGQTSWTIINPPAADYFQDVFALDANIAIAVGARGGIYRTTDGGTTWNPHVSPISDDLQDVFFINSTTGWIVGGTKIMKSTDAGISWTLQYSGFAGQMNAVHFINSSVGWVCGAYGDIYKTTDGGANWVDQIPVNLTFGWLQSIFFIDANNGWAVGTSKSYASTTDGGATWNISELQGGVLYKSIFFTSATEGWLAGDSDLLKTTDGGANWGTANSGLSSAAFGYKIMHSIYFVSSSTGYIVGNNGKFARTTNGNTSNPTWTVSTIAGEENYYSVSFGTSSTGWVVGNGGVIQKTTNSGGAWTAQVEPITTEKLNATFFVSSNTGWAVGENGIVVTTTDGGSSWSTVNLGTTNTLFDVYFPSADVGYICGDAVFYYTKDGGTTWTSRTVINEYYSTKFINDNIGWIVGSTGFGTLFKTTNRGSSWTALSPAPPSPLYDLAIVDANTLVAVGYSGSIQRTTNGGTSWSAVTSGTTDILRTVHFVNSSVGYIGTDNGKVLKSTDGGATWSTILSGAAIAFSDIHFISETEGWAVAGDKDTWYTDDGGATWTVPDNALSNQALNSIYFPTASTGFRVGDLGNIHKGTTSLSGQVPVFANNINPLIDDIDIPISSNLLYLVWEDGGGEPATSYTLCLGTDGGGTVTPTNVVNGASMGGATSYQHPSDLQYSTKYYWQIVPANGNGAASNCPIWSFTTREDLNFGGGGTNAPGYFFANSTPSASGAPSQPTYGWVDPVLYTHTEIASWTSGDADDGFFGPHTMGITFPFFGNNFTEIYIGTNGLLTFGTGYSVNGASATIPDAAEPNNMIAACFMDLYSNTTGKVYYGVTGGKFVVTWFQYYDKGTSEYITFQVLLSASGYIEFQYNDSESTFPLQIGIGDDALIGIEDEYGSAGVLYRNNGVGGPIFGSPLAVAFGDDNSALPVELTSFYAASTSSKTVVLNWTTATEVNNYGFSVLRLRSATENEWEKIGFVEGHGNSNSPKDYSFVDSNPRSGKSLYRLKQIDIDGAFEYSETISVEINILGKYILEQNYPNPFNPTTNINFSIPVTGHVKLTVYNTIGQRVATLVNGIKNAGYHNISFNAANLISGIYFYKLESGDFVQVEKMMLLK
ncbi:MAG: YCF48-related protein [Melioribacteraceae bacterium]|nr:YCF48-related protein [Melioribacteraceae bacterium]